MKKHLPLKRLLSMVLCLCIMASLATVAFAATADSTSVIDTSKTGTIHIHKIDFTNAAKDGVWDNSYVSTGRQDSALENKLITNAQRAGDTDTSSVLGNNQTSNGYAVKGVEFTYKKVGEITTFSKSSVAEDGTVTNHTQVVYGFNMDTDKALLDAIGLTQENDRYVPADELNNGLVYFESDTLVHALRASLAANATTVKNAVESYVKNGGTTMPLTDENGYTTATNLPLGLYLIVETKVPEHVTNTTNPFFISLPSTSVNGGGTGLTETGFHTTDGGDNWMYEMHLYPKNETGIPSLEKTVRESQDDTGNNNASTTITDGFAHTATGSTGDVMEYQIISTLPAITSDATALSEYFFFDTLSKGLTYTKGDVKIEFFTDTACATTPVATWTETNINSTNFTVKYIPNQTNDAAETAMEIKITQEGLDIINGKTSTQPIYTANGDVRRGYSDLTMRITYTAKIDSNNTVAYGDAGNANEVVLTWRRTSSEYLDTLIDDCHVYTYGIDLTKIFQGANADFGPVQDTDYASVEFVLYNDTDDYWVKAELNQEEGVYYVTDHMINNNGNAVSGYDGVHGDLTAEETAKAASATIFKPLTDDASVGTAGKIIIKGLEDDSYILTEINTADGYTLLKDHINFTISVTKDEICDIYSDDTLGVVQNDARYQAIVNEALAKSETVLGLGNTIPQKHLEHQVLTASAVVDGNDTTMLNDGDSENAFVSMEVINTHGFDLPQTGDNTAMWMGIGGAAIAAIAAFAIVFFFVPKHKKESDEQE